MYWVHQERAELHRTWDLCWVIKPEVENQFVNRFAGLLLLFNVFLKPRTWIFRNYVFCKCFIAALLPRDVSDGKDFWD